ncbi:FtsX-like permease family protein [Rhodanobacter sp. FDAARGOS 1247]|uniref:ABC transporter permease n=1 Tax=Rhodanobacter sp. FDAARGOS 1247 TaxID=2778082 RepID=UPI00195012CA|nr:FtsX-like permease family protein [Rhodanobacter sp. FDAARGOS 1247]QRP64634.1 FtsX-like permease family protein [Rhodanobacter sp. FDAARGOS 1247]
MELRPILSTLRRHKLTATLLVLQAALTCAIVCNVVFMIANRVQRIGVPTGIAERELSVIPSTGIEEGENPQARHAADLAALRGVRGVQSAVAVSYSLPLDRSESSSGICPSKQALDRAMQLNTIEGSGCMQPAVYDGTPGLVGTLGLHLVAGRDFRPEEYVSQGKPAVAIVSRALAQHLYPGKQALGQSMYDGDNYIRIVGIVDRLLRPNLRAPGIDEDSMIWPQLPPGSGVLYVLRSASGDRARILQEGSAELLKLSANRLISAARTQTYEEIRAAYFQRDTTMIGLLLASALGLLFVTALGITGLANFWVQQRTRSIGIRRAIGATRGDILRYFQTENFLIVGAGIVLGMLLAFLLNAELMQHYELARLPLLYLPMGALVLWGLGQLAVLGPALRAAAVPPVVATRST